MPKKYTRRYRKRSYKSKKMTKFNLYRNRSSKAQAYQIAKVNKKVNTMYRKLKPTTYRIDNGNQTVIGWGADLAVATPVVKTNPGHAMTIYPPADGIRHCNYHGCRIHVDFAFDYPSSTYSLNSNTTPEVVARFILVQYKSKRAQIGWADLTTNNTVMAGVFEPLDLHINSKVKILKDFRLTINQKIPARHFNIKYSKNIDINTTDGNGQEKNIVELWCIAYNSGATTTTIGSYSTSCQAHIYFKTYNYVSYDAQ